MKKTAFGFLLALPLAAAAFRPYVTLSVKPGNVVVTESAEAEVRIVTPSPFRRNPTIGADFIPQGSRLQMERGQETVNGTNAWIYTVRLPVPAGDPGRRMLGPVRVSIPLRTDFFGFVSRSLDLESGTAVLETVSPPEAGRPDTYCGAISRGLSAVAKLDASVCTAGDPLLLSLEISGATDPAMVYPAAVAKFFEGTLFKLDEASLKTETLASSKIFTWRVRAMKAGTTELPPLEIAWFDSAKREYRISRTEAIPVQIKAGVQAALGSMDTAGGETDEFPMPDGIDLGFAEKDFTLRHAVALAVRAVDAKDFLAAAGKYREFTSSAGCDSLPAVGRAMHHANLGALLVMAGKPRDAIEAFLTAELATGATPCTLRGLKSAYARLKNDPRADLPLQRIMFPFWFNLALRGRIVFSACAVIALALLFFLAVRAGGRLSVIAVALTLGSAAHAWPFGGRSLFDDFFDDSPRMRFGRGSQVCPVKAAAWFASTSVSVGEPVELFVAIDPGQVRIDHGSLGLNAEFPEKSAHGEATSATAPNTFRIRATFLDSGTNAVKLTVGGTYSGTYCMTNGNSIMSGRVMNQSFSIELNPEPVVVKPLPAKGRHLDFTGAVGNSFRLTQKLVPANVRPGDLVTAEYRLDYDGYFPSNTVPRIDNLSREFKAYEIKETARDARSVTWQQILVPRTTDATNSALVSLSCYNVRQKRYERVMAKPARLVFISDTASPTENTSVLVTAQPSTTAVGSAPGKPIELRFAPSGSSPVVVTLPPGTEKRETGARNGWKRYESARGAGWAKVD